MFPTVKPAGVGSISSATQYSVKAAAGGREKGSIGSFDEFHCSLSPSSTEARVRKTAGEISQKVRIRPTNGELDALKQQILNGTYEINVSEIAARMLMSLS